MTALEKIQATNGARIAFSFEGNPFPVGSRIVIFSLIASGSHKLDSLSVSRAFPEDWNWNWIAYQGNYRGKLTTRINKLVREKLKFQMSARRLESLGTLLSARMTAKKRFSFDFDQTLNWKGGDFGDGKSCFFRGYDDTRAYMRANGFWAVRFYTLSSNIGKARAWLYPIHEGKSLIIMNAYGLPSLTIAEVLQSWLALANQRAIDLQNSEDTLWYLYRNGDARIITNGPDDSIWDPYTFTLTESPSEEMRKKSHEAYEAN